MFSKIAKVLTVAVAVGAACYRILQRANAKDGHKQSEHFDARRFPAEPANDPAQSRPRKEFTCKRCHQKTEQPVAYEGRIVCLTCANILDVEKARLSQHLCARCKVDLFKIPTCQIRRIGDEEYCDVCAAKIAAKKQSRRQVFDAVFQKMSSLGHALPSVQYTEKDGDYFIETSPNHAGYHIYVDITEEISLEFAYWHCHYDYNDGAQYLEFYEDLYAIVLNRACAASAFDVVHSPEPEEPEDAKRWRGSMFLDAERLSPDIDKNIAFLADKFGDAQCVQCDVWDASKSKVFHLIGDFRCIHDPLFSSVIDNYPLCILDYRILQCTQPSRGLASHREALRCAMRDIPDIPDSTRALQKDDATRIDPSELFAEPPDAWAPGCSLPNGTETCDRIPYWYAFLEPPYPNLVQTRPACGSHPARRRKATVADFRTVNKALFPQGTDDLEIYKWTTDWSPYFDDGHEWWGTGCWSVYDRRMKRYVVILASASD